MKLVKISCPNCGASLECENDQNLLQCKYCHAKIFMDDEKIRVEHTIYDEKNINKTKNAETALKFGEYKTAFSLFTALSKDYSFESEIWYNLIKCKTEMFSLIDIFVVNEFDCNESYEAELENSSLKYHNIKDECDKYFDKYSKLENDNTLLGERKKEYNNYIQKLEEHYNDYLTIMKNNYKEFDKEMKVKIKLAFSCGLIAIICIVVVAIIITIYSILEKQSEIKRNEMIKEFECRAYCNDSDGIITNKL